MAYATRIQARIRVMKWVAHGLMYRADGTPHFISEEFDADNWVDAAFQQWLHASTKPYKYMWTVVWTNPQTPNYEPSHAEETQLKLLKEEWSGNA